MNRELDGKVALVTGAGTGIGLEISRRLCCAGATVILSGRSPEPVTKAARDLVSEGYGASALPFDAGDEEAVGRAFDDILSRHGRLDILVNNAGTLHAGDVFETSFDDWDTTLRNNLTSAFLCSQRALSAMRDAGEGGRIVMIGSTAGQRGAPAGAVAYSAAKAGLSGLAKTLAYTAAPFGVTVNMVAPGMIDTAMLRAGFGDRLDAAAAQVPLGLGQTGDIAPTVLFLVSDAARYITGATLDVNGGLYMR